MGKKLQIFLEKQKLKYPEKELQLWFQDEARFGQKGIVSKIWTLEGDRPILPRQNGFKSAYFIGAVNPKNGDKCALLYDGVDSIVMNHFLANISQKVGENIRIVMIVDGAGWHSGEDLKIPSNIVLYYLPPYSPELNPIERLWSYLKENFLSGRCLENMEEIFEYGQRAWRQLTRNLVKSICKTSCKQ